MEKDSNSYPKEDLDNSLVPKSSNNANVNPTSIAEPNQSGIKSEAIDKNINPAFGSMETIPLEMSVHEDIPISQSSNSENLNTNNLIKYFSTDVSKQENVDPDGINFFNKLSETTTQAVENLSKDENQTQLTQDQNINPAQETVHSEKESFTCDNSSKNNDGSEKPPEILLKFFSEDKSGDDKDGKAFFDKISEEKLNNGISALHIEEPIVKASGSEFFLSSPTTNEIEEAWIPSEKTRQILVAVITSKVPFSPDKSDLAMPGVIVEEEMEDPVKNLLIECNSPYAHQRKVLTANDVSEDEDGLKKLMESKCYHAAINLTKRLLSTIGQGLGCDGKPSKHSPQSLKLWYTRLALLVKLRKFSLAEVESAAFGDLDKCDLYYEFYPDVYKGKKGSMVPFALRLLLAELPQYQGNHQIALDNMYHILNIIQKMLNNIKNGYAEDGSMIELSDSRKSASLEVWKKREIRVLFSILNCVLTQKDYVVAVSITKTLIEKSGSDTTQLYSALGRIYLQLGDVQYAEICFKEASLVATRNKQDFRVEENINNALLSIACDENEKGFKYFEQAYSIEPSPMVVNNMAVCKLYTGQLKEALKLLESAIHKSPTSCLHDGLLFNVCTLYELESSRCPQKKLAMLELISKYVGDSFNVNCLKIQTAKA